MRLSLFYFAAAGDHTTDPYRLLIEGARFADTHGLAGVWTPERHFDVFGGPYPNPAVTSAAVAAVTERVPIRAGSVVAPLHDPLRITEEWSVVDALSNGRVEISFASGWVADDFVLSPEQYADRRKLLFDRVDEVRALWRGDSVRRPSPAGGEVELTTFPRPVQPELPVWVTAASTPATFEQAGRIGADVLTHLLGQDLDELVSNIARYRRARALAGHNGHGRVAAMLHTFVGEDEDGVARHADGPIRDYLRSSLGLVGRWVRAEGDNVDVSTLSEADVDALVSLGLARVVENSLVGTLDQCLERLSAFEAAGIDEVGCLIDFGVPTDVVLASLPRVAELQTLSEHERRREDKAGDSAAQAERHDIATLIRRHGITHVQCTPSAAGLLVRHERACEALCGLDELLIGGEAFPAALAASLRDRVGVPTRNLYGPTEATVWATTHVLDDASIDAVPIGHALDNTTVHVLDDEGSIVPAGVAGQIYIGGGGVAAGYWRRPGLTADRFVPDPFGPPGARMYRTGDLARRRPDGTLVFLGRVDDQVKLHGHRIELGEIEAEIAADPEVERAIVALEGASTLTAYVRLRTVDASATDAVRLPNGMVAHGDREFVLGVYDEVFGGEYAFEGLDLPAGACVIDGGANIGMFTLFAHTVARSPRVFAFEPIPQTFGLLERNVRVNGLPVTIANEGLGAEPGVARFTHLPASPGLSGRYVDIAGEMELARRLIGDVADDEAREQWLAERYRSEQQECTMTTVSAVIARHRLTRVDLLKVDVERSELDVLAGIEEADWPKIRQAVFEIHGESALAGVLEALHARGFATTTRTTVSLEQAGASELSVYAVYARAADAPPALRPIVAPQTRSDVSGNGSEVWQARLRKRLRATLPAAMVPGRFVAVHELPMTPNGKVDRRALKNMAASVPARVAPPPAAPVEAPAAPPAESSANDVRAVITETWKAVLDIADVSVDTNFFDAGGDSMRALQVHLRLSEAFDRPPTIVDLFTYPTIAALAAHLSSAGARPIVSVGG
jgi:natural product biosynthesis luciferase-like monooxygenase protein/FkbM family methyltransferase